ncbi:MAG: hypothetical protein V3T53_15765 [Phycisphaerales bacterium]
MRIDHHAYRKATRVAGFGFALQALAAITILVFALGLFGSLARDVVLRFAAIYLFGGLFVWLSLIAVFYQHTQERLESLEEDELAAEQATAGSMFAAREHEKVAARRLRLMHKWLMPAVSLLVVAYLSLAAWRMWRYLDQLDASAGEGDFVLTGALGWAVAICLAFAAVCFVVSRFVAGMAKQTAWQNLRGGAGYMVGNAIVLMAVAVGIIFRFFENDQVIGYMAYAIPIGMIVLAIEIVLNFILNLYRPRIPGEVRRPAFDSRILSLLSAPDALVKSINDAVNYQFGFDITSSWGYQLLLRSFAWLLAFGVIAIVVLDTIVVVEPHQQAIKLSWGRVVGDDVYHSGIMWKWPWPVQSAAIYEVGRIRELPLTVQRINAPDIDDWSQAPRTEGEIEPFLVIASRMTAAAPDREPGSVADGRPAAGPDAPFEQQSPVSTDQAEASAEPTEKPVGELISLVDAEVTLQYRIKPDGLRDYLNFSTDFRGRRQRLTMRDRALKALALREITQHLSRLSMEEVISRGDTNLARQLHDRIQTTFDKHETGVLVVAVNLPMLRPSGNAGTYFEEFAIAKHQRRETVAKERAEAARTFMRLLGDLDWREEIFAQFDKWEQLRRDSDVDADTVLEQRLVVERLLAEAGGDLSDQIDRAEAARWVTLMEARAEAFKHQGKLASYQVAPELFMQREIMNVLSGTLANRRKYFVIGVDPDRIKIDIDIQDMPSLFTTTRLGADEGKSNQ